MQEIELPLCRLRDYQKDLWLKLIDPKVKQSFILMHRRAGKDVLCLQFMVAKAISEAGNYWYILPQQNQVRRSIWEGITRDGFKYLDFFPKQFVEKVNDSEMKVFLKNGSIVSFLGGDRYDSLVGAGIKGCVISEFALQAPSLYDLVIKPMLVESGGWIIFNTTPRGDNHARDMYEFLKKEPNSVTCRLTIDDTHVIDKAELDQERRRGVPEEIIQQEYYVSFAGVIHGAYYADVLNNVSVGDYPYDARYPVHTCWDLGVSDSMAIWFIQFIEGRVRVIDYYENSTYGLGHYASVVQSKGYAYAGHHLPHDGVQRQLTPDEKAQSIQGQLLKLGLNQVDIVPRTKDVYADICAVRAILPICQFDKKADAGFKALRQYRREWDENRQCFKNNPLHDWTSHASDAFRIVPYLERGVMRKDVRDFKAVEWNGKW